MGQWYANRRSMWGAGVCWGLRRGREREGAGPRTSRGLGREGSEVRRRVLAWRSWAVWAPRRGAGHRGGDWGGCCLAGFGLAGPALGGPPLSLRDISPLDRGRKGKEGFRRCGAEAGHSRLGGVGCSGPRVGARGIGEGIGVGADWRGLVLRGRRWGDPLCHFVTSPPWSGGERGRRAFGAVELRRDIVALAELVALGPVSSTGHRRGEAGEEGSRPGRCSG